MRSTLTIILLQILVPLALSCTQQSENSELNKLEVEKIDSIAMAEFQSAIDKENLSGCVLIFDQKENRFYSNDFNWANKGQLPASTFKIPNSIIALELEIVKDSSTILAWNGEPQMNPRWEQNLKLKDAFQFSCVPCYQSIARQIGLKSMKNYVNKLNYGNMKIDASNLDLFWLMGDSKITAFEQIEFLQNFNDQKLDIKTATFQTMRFILQKEETNEYKLFGKTGWSTDNNHHNTWFVGFLETQENTFYFATNLEPNEDANIGKLAQNRIALTKSALKAIGIKL